MIGDPEHATALVFERSITALNFPEYIHNRLGNPAGADG
jgi:hypothetical protein